MVIDRCSILPTTAQAREEIGAPSGALPFAGRQHHLLTRWRLACRSAAPSGRRVDRSYDARHRLTDANAAMFGGDHWHRFTYDALDNLRSWKLGGVKDYANYVYDASNRLTSIKNTGGSTLHTLSYDVQGNVTAKDTASYTFDFGNRLRLGTGPGGSEGYRYDGHGRRALAWVPAGATLSFYVSFPDR